MALLASLECQSWRVEIRGRVANLTATGAESLAVSKVTGPGTLHLFVRNSEELSIADGVASHTPLLSENTEYDIYFTRTSGAAKIKLPPAAVLKYESEQLSHYSINFRNDVGFVDVVVMEGKSQATATLEVFPSKLDYRADYVQMRDEVASLARNLVIGINARTYAPGTPVPLEKPTDAEWSSLLQGYFASYKRLAQSIIAIPHTVLERRIECVPLQKVRKLDRRKLRLFLRRQLRKPSGLSVEGRPMPSTLPELSRRTSYDTAENRHVKYLLKQTSFRLQQIVRIEASGDEDADLTAEEKFFNFFRPIAKEMLRDVERLLQSSFLRDIRSCPAPASGNQVLQKHPVYSAFGRVAHILNGGLSATGGLLRIGLKHIAELYEYWCFLKLVELLRSRFELVQQTLVRVRHTGVVVTLQKGMQAAVRFRNAEGKFVDVVYNRTFLNLPTLAQRPDNIIQLTDGRAFHILDAKYKVASDFEYKEQFGGAGPTTEDINTMHRYRDAIVLPQVLGGGGYELGVVKDAVVLFPSHDEEAYRNNRFYNSIKEVQIGGLPCLPNSTELLQQHLASILSSDGLIGSTYGGQT